MSVIENLGGHWSQRSGIDSSGLGGDVSRRNDINGNAWFAVSLLLTACKDRIRAMIPLLPFGPSSSAKDTVKEVKADFDAAKTASILCPILAAILPILMMRPPLDM